MTELIQFNNDIFNYAVLPLLIFIARVADVSIGTLRIVYLSRGRKYLAPALGFIEILIWLLAIGQIFQNLNNIACYAAFAGGFAAGNFVGISLENKLALGIQVVRIITSRDAGNLIHNLRANGYGITVVDGLGASGPVKIIFTLIPRKELPRIVGIVRTHNPKAFYTVEDVRQAESGILPATVRRNRLHYPWSKFNRKSK